MPKHASVPHTATRPRKIRDFISISVGARDETSRFVREDKRQLIPRQTSCLEFRLNKET
jgi:hypothetical protein